MINMGYLNTYAELVKTGILGKNSDVVFLSSD